VGGRDKEAEAWDNRGGRGSSKKALKYFQKQPKMLSGKIGNPF